MSAPERDDDLMFIPHGNERIAVPPRMTTGDTISGVSVSWVRADLHDTLRAERDALAERVEAARADAMNDAIKVAFALIDGLAADKRKAEEEGWVVSSQWWEAQESAALRIISGIRAALSTAQNGDGQ
jgi:hypothetical protein